jgi:hypothetical protein
MNCLHFKLGDGSFGAISLGGNVYVFPFKGKHWRFEFDARFGPSPVDIHGELTEEDITDENHPFWKAFNAWFDHPEKEKFVGKLIKKRNGNWEYRLNEDN